MNKRRLFVLSFSIVCVVITAAGLLYWWSEQVAEQKLQECIRSLNREGDYIIEEHPFSDFHIDQTCKEHDFTDFHQAVSISGIDHVYYDRGRHLLYFLGDSSLRGIEATVFNYKWGKM